MRLSILIVDDDEAIRLVLRAFLESRGCQVATAEDGVEGLDALRSKLFDVVVADVKMPRRDGLWMWQEAIAVRPDLRGRFVFISGVPFGEVDHGVEDERFLLKPFGMTTLWTAINEVAK